MSNTDDDNDPSFYAPPAGTDDLRFAGYCKPSRDAEFQIRVTPGPVELLKGERIDFTVHVKALKDFGAGKPLVLQLLSVEGAGTAALAKPDQSVVVGKPILKFDDDRILITILKSDEAARVVIKTDYPPDWWAGFTRVSVQVNGGAGIPERCVEANVIVADRKPAEWLRYVDGNMA